MKEKSIEIFETLYDTPFMKEKKAFRKLSGKRIASTDPEMQPNFAAANVLYVSALASLRGMKEEDSLMKLRNKNIYKALETDYAFDIFEVIINNTCDHVSHELAAELQKLHIIVENHGATHTHEPELEK